MNTSTPRRLAFWHPAALLATWFGTGLLPWAPGTWGSLAALPFAWIIHSVSGPVGLAAAAGLVFIAGLWASALFARHAGEEDPGAVVIDEVAGQWLVLVVVVPDIYLYAAGFLLFRAADIVKPWPVSWAERALKGGAAIMVDDVLAAVYAAATLLAATTLMEM